MNLFVLKEIFSDGFLQNVKKKGRILCSDLEKLVLNNSTIFELVRGRGLMLGLKCKVQNSEIIELAYENKLLLVPAADNVVRILPPLNITDQEICIARDRFISLAKGMKEKM